MIHSALYFLIDLVRRVIRFLAILVATIMVVYVVILFGTMYATGYSFSDFRIYDVSIGYALFAGGMIDVGLAILVDRVVLSYQRRH